MFPLRKSNTAEHDEQQEAVKEPPLTRQCWPCGGRETDEAWTTQPCKCTLRSLGARARREPRPQTQVWLPTGWPTDPGHSSPRPQGEGDGERPSAGVTQGACALGMAVAGGQHTGSSEAPAPPSRCQYVSHNQQTFSLSSRFPVLKRTHVHVPYSKWLPNNKTQTKEIPKPGFHGG